MSKGKKISVALAAYKGEKFITEQLESIVFQLKDCDEIIVSDDLPGGETEQIVRAFAEKDARVKYIHGPQKGLIKNFENAIKHCTGDYIFLCDQDDVWLPDKVEQVTAKLDEGFMLVLHNAMVTDEKLTIKDTSFFKSHGTKTGFTANLLKNSYMGCCMAFSRDLCGRILPFAENLPMHDQWIGLLAEKTGKVCLVEKPLILYRRHGSNMTGGKTSLKQKIMWRISIAQKIKERLS
ncbi:MAG: glycosyltransferase family 2 protein [Ruminococcaceae bacterium]|nr:glycosyltransferase family 2 protein [Oscillospiraceae bacterium]